MKKMMVGCKHGFVCGFMLPLMMGLLLMSCSFGEYSSSPSNLEDRLISQIDEFWNASGEVDEIIPRQRRLSDLEKKLSDAAGGPVDFKIWSFRDRRLVLPDNCFFRSKLLHGIQISVIYEKRCSALAPSGSEFVVIWIGLYGKQDKFWGTTPRAEGENEFAEATKSPLENQL